MPSWGNGPVVQALLCGSAMNFRAWFFDSRGRTECYGPKTILAADVCVAPSASGRIWLRITNREDCATVGEGLRDYSALQNEPEQISFRAPPWFVCEIKIVSYCRSLCLRLIQNDHAILSGDAKPFVKLAFQNKRHQGPVLRLP